MSVASEKLAGSIQVLKAVAETIRELGEVPSGHLYAQLMGKMNLEQYQSMIRILKDTGLISESGFVLKWCGPQV